MQARLELRHSGLVSPLIQINTLIQTDMTRTCSEFAFGPIGNIMGYLLRAS